MPIVSNAANQIALQNASNLSEGLSSLGLALNNPQAWANADLLRAHKAHLGAQTALLTQQKAAYDDIYNNLRANNVPDAQAKLTAGIIVSSHGTADQAASSIGNTIGTINQMNTPLNAPEMQYRQNTLLRDPKAIFNNDTAFTTQQQAIVPQLKPVTFDPNSQAVGIPAMMSGAMQPASAPAAVPQIAPAGAAPTVASPAAPSAPQPAAPQPLGNALQQPGVLASPDGLGPKYMRQNLNKVANFFAPEVLARTKSNIQNEKLLLALDKATEVPAALLPPGSQPETFNADQTQASTLPIKRQLAGMLPNWFGNAADQDYSKISSQIQMGGGLGSTLAGKITNEQLGVAGQSTPNIGMLREARVNVNRDQLSKDRQMEDAQELVARAYQNRQLSPQIGEILSGFAQSPEASNIQMDPETKLPRLVPTMRLQDYVKKNYPDVNGQPGLYTKLYSGAAPDLNDPNLIKAIQQQLNQPAGGTAVPVAAPAVQTGVGTALTQPGQLTPAEQAELMARRAKASQGMQTGGGF